MALTILDVKNRISYNGGADTDEFLSRHSERFPHGVHPRCQQPGSDQAGEPAQAARFTNGVAMSQRAGTKRMRSICVSDDLCLEVAVYSENLKGAYFGSPVGPGFRDQIQRARRLTPAGGLRKVARVALAASMLLAGRGEGGTT